MGIALSKIEVGHYYDSDSLVWCTTPNFAGGVGVRFSFKNTGTKTIKYITFYVTPYNAVDDPVVCSIRLRSEAALQFTGPLVPNQVKSYVSWENVWYNNSIKYAKLTKVYIQYMDGTDETVPVSQVTLLRIAGCYVATAVYGSYDCPEVWTLRRYRDYTLAETWYGRAFIKIYYAISPSLVKWFGHTEWFKKMWKGKLDRMVSELQSKGVESTPYEDRVW
jgi:hypothetical protein